MHGLDMQVLSTAVMFLTGVALALFHDLSAVVAGQSRSGSTGRVRPHRRVAGRRVFRLWDLIYCLLVTPVVFAAIMACTGGELRLYVFLGLGLGVVVYFTLAGPLVVRVTSALRAALIKGAMALVAWLARPVRAVAAALGRLGRGSAAAGRRLGGGCLRGGKRLGQKTAGVVRVVGSLPARVLAGFPRQPRE